MKRRVPLTSNRVATIWEHLRASFWFLPSLMVAAAGMLAVVLLELDARLSLEQFGPLQPLLYGGGTQATRGLLSTIGSAMLTVAGTSFSITIAVLTLAASNYGPRLLRNFMQDRGNQFVLGTFVATFLYCLLVLRSVQDVEDTRFVPHLATTFAIALAILGIGVLVYFIHHIAASIQVATIVRGVGDELHATIDRVFPERSEPADAPGAMHGERDVPGCFAHERVAVDAAKSGYVQSVDHEALLALSSQHDLIVQLAQRPGQFVVRGNPLLYAWPAARLNDELRAQIRHAYSLGKQRTLTQDVEFGILQLEEVAVRALSPSLNDPYTAVNCLDQLSVALCTLAERPAPARYRYDSNNQLRLIATPLSYASLLDSAFDQIRMNGAQFVMVLTTMLDVIAVVAQRVGDGATLSELRRHARLVERSSHAAITDEHDRAKVEARFAATMRTLRACEAALVKNIDRAAGT